MNIFVQVAIVILGVLLTGIVGMNTYIQRDVRDWLKRLTERFDDHVIDRDAHCKRDPSGRRK